MTDSINLVFRRWLADDTPEADNAMRALKRKLQGQASKVHIVPEGYTNPLRFVVDEQTVELEALKKRLKRAETRVKTMTNRATKAEARLTAIAAIIEGKSL